MIAGVVFYGNVCHQKFLLKHALKLNILLLSDFEKSLVFFKTDWTF